VPKKFQLPLTPKVITRDTCVYVCFEDGSEMFWGDEDSIVDAIVIARELELELRAVKYLKTMIKDFVEDMMAYLYSVDASEDLIVSIIKDGHNFAFNELDNYSKKQLRLNEKPDIKQTIIEKLEIAYII
jgi:hypothetical protein